MKLCLRAGLSSSSLLRFGVGGPRFRMAPCAGIRHPPPKAKALTRLGFPRRIRAFHQSGRQDLNLRPLGPELQEALSHPLSPTVMGSQLPDNTGGRGTPNPSGGSQSTPSGERFVAPLSPVKVPPEGLLRVADVARALGVSKGDGLQARGLGYAGHCSGGRVDPVPGRRPRGVHHKEPGADRAAQA